MPDRLGFDHLPNWGAMHHRCVECGWPGPMQFVSEADRRRHHGTHEKARKKRVKAMQEANLAKARRAKRKADREGQR